MARKDILASNQQLYVLNRAGMLSLNEEPGDPVMADDANWAIKASIVKQGRQGKQALRPRHATPLEE